MPISLRAAALVALSLTALSGCGSEDADPEGLWGEKSDNTPYLELAEDGRLTGSDGCNRLMGSWQDDDGTLTFTEVASTKMACPEMDTWLSALASATIDGTTMVVLDAEGTEIGQLDTPGPK